MPVDDWTRVEAGICHDFQVGWITGIRSVLNQGLLPSEYYAMAEQVMGGFGPDILTLQRVANGPLTTPNPTGGLEVAVAPPRVEMRTRAERDQNAGKAKSVVIRQASNDQVIAILKCRSSCPRKSTFPSH